MSILNVQIQSQLQVIICSQNCIKTVLRDFDILTTKMYLKKLQIHYILPFIST